MKKSRTQTSSVRSPTWLQLRKISKITDCLIARRSRREGEGRNCARQMQERSTFSVSVSMATVITAYIYRPSISKELKALSRHIIFLRERREKGRAGGRQSRREKRGRREEGGGGGGGHGGRGRRSRGGGGEARTWCASQMAQSEEVGDSRRHAKPATAGRRGGPNDPRGPWKPGRGPRADIRVKPPSPGHAVLFSATWVTM